MAKVKQFCPQGHDTFICGRQTIGRGCNGCKRDYQVKNGRWWTEHRISNADGAPFTRLDFDRAYQVQQGCCKICGTHQSDLKRRLFVDHDHRTGIFRGLLCDACNKTLGHAKDSIEILIDAVRYLRRGK